IHCPSRINDRNPPSASMRSRIEPMTQFAQLLYSDVARRRFLGGASLFIAKVAFFMRHGVRAYASQIGVIAARHPAAGSASPASQALLGLLAKQAGCSGLCKCTLSDARQAMDEPGMCKALALRKPYPCCIGMPGQKLRQRVHG